MNECCSGTHKVWICDCRDGAHRASLLVAMNYSHRSVVEAAADANCLSRCHHLDTLDDIVRRMPLLIYPRCDEEDPTIIRLNEHPMVVSFKHQNDSNRSVVYICRSGKLRCHSCSFQCDHVRDVKALLDYHEPNNPNQQSTESIGIDDHDDNGNDDVEPETEPDSIQSKERIPLLEPRDRSHACVPSRLVPLKQHDAKCLCGAEWNENPVFSRKVRTLLPTLCCVHSAHSTCLVFCSGTCL
jgi:hypothetical protein